MESSISVLHIIDTLKKGGAERLLVDSVKQLHLTRPDIKQYICTLKSKDDEILLSGEVERISLNLSIGNILKSWKNLDAFIKDRKITIIHAHLIDSILFSRFLSSSTIKKKVFTYHNFDYDKKYVYHSKWRAFTDKITFKKKYIPIYVSEEIKYCIEQVTGKANQSYVLNNFANPSFFYKYKLNPDFSIDAITVANLRKTKNLELAVTELEFLKDYPIRIHIYGEGPLRNSLEKEITRTNVKLYLHGRHDITTELLCRHDLFLMTSQSEGLPLSLLEAMTSGLPSVLPDHLPIFKRVAKNSAVFYSITKPGDLASKLKSLLENKSLLMELSENAKVDASKYNITYYIEHLLNIYCS